jgi:hypothetical protein
MDAETFRTRAHECRQLASMVSQPENRAFWLRLASDWLNVAALSEKHRRREDKQGTMRARWIQPQTLTEKPCNALSPSQKPGMVEVYKGIPILMPCGSMMYISALEPEPMSCFEMPGELPETNSVVSPRRERRSGAWRRRGVSGLVSRK